MPQSTDLVQGTLDLLIMQTVALKPMHGWVLRSRFNSCQKTSCRSGRVRFIRRYSALNIRGGYDRNGGSRRITGGRRAKFYHLSPEAKKQLEAELATWDRLSSAIASVLGRAAEASS